MTTSSIMRARHSASNFLVTLILGRDGSAVGEMRVQHGSAVGEIRDESSAEIQVTNNTERERKSQN